MYIRALLYSWHTIHGGSILHLCMSVRLISVCIANASALFLNMETVIVIWHLIKRHKQLPGLVYEVKASLYASTGCNWKDSFTARWRSSAWSRQATLFCFGKFSLVLSITPTALCFFTLDTVGSHLHACMLLIEAFVTKIIMYLSDFIMQIIKQHGYHFMIGSNYKKQSRASDQAQFLQLNSFDPGHKCFYKYEKWLALKLC